jgi:16S rRNA (cytidine1402-2'-O)-methyltransferase
LTTIKGKLYIVATPIGNLGDLTHRAAEVLREVALIAAEDTRQTRQLLQHYAIRTKLVAVHEHNEYRRVPELIARIAGGESIALVSDAGTPLINDPGFELVSAAIEKGLTVVPVPGPSALMCALPVSGLAIDRFSFYGFPPRSPTSRRALFESLLEHPNTLVFYESCHRIIECLTDCVEIFPAERKLVIARELTKAHETITRTRVGDALGLIKADLHIQKGELVLLVEGATVQKKTDELSTEDRRILEILLEKCSLRNAVDLAGKITGLRRKLLYSAALEIAERGRDHDI